MSDIPRAMRRAAKHDTRVEQADLLRWADHLERVEAERRDIDRGYQALEQRLHEMEDERERLRALLSSARHSSRPPPTTRSNPMRKVIQIAADSQPSGPEWNAWSDVIALCDDGSIWSIDCPFAPGAKWMRLPDVPQDEETADAD